MKASKKYMNQIYRAISCVDDGADEYYYPCKPIKGSRLNMMAGKNFFKCFYEVVSGGLFMFGDSLMDKAVARFIGAPAGKVSAFYADRPAFNDNARYVVEVFRTPAEGWYWTFKRI